MTGKIVRAIAGFYYVRCAGDGREYQCRARGLFRKDGRKPLVGDDCAFHLTHTEDTEGSVDEILPRKNALVRPPVANVDQAVVVFALKSPEPSLSLLDRFLILMKRQGIETVILFNKIDLAGEGSSPGKEPAAGSSPGEGQRLDTMDGCPALERLKDIYRGSGCRLYGISVKEGIGLEKVRDIFRGKTSVLAGPSGVGKSSLTNFLCPEAGMQTGEVSRQTRRGKQTTRHAQLFSCGEDSYFFDTPGFSSLELTGMKPEEVKEYFPEFEEFEPLCRFQGCMHMAEPACGVKDAVRDGRISRVRYDSYRQLAEELKASGRRR